MTMNTTGAVRHDLEIPDVLKMLADVHATMDTYGFDRTLHHLILLRASQINRCGFCVKMHSRDARQHGETEARLDRLIVWDQVADFTDREKAALAWTEALTILNPDVDLAALRGRLRKFFADKEISVLTATIGMINLWNRIRISGH